MSFFFALLVWVLLAAVLAGGVVLAAHGHMMLLGLGMLVFVAGFIKFGCLTH